jgi:arylsulfatase A-like enzyme
MGRSCRGAAALVILGVAVGSCVGILESLAERYPQQGLHGLALHLWVEAVEAYLTVALAGGCAALLIRAAGQALDRGREGLATAVAEAGAWLAASLPVFVWIGVRDRWLLPGDGRIAVASYLLLILALVFVHRTVRSRRARRGLATPAWRALSAVSTLCLLLAGGIFAADRLRVLAPRQDGARPNLLLIVLDTVRVDRLSVYGYPRQTTPELDAFANRAIRYTNFYSTSSWTVPSHASLFTGLYAVRHGATQERGRLDGEFATLAEILQNAGYQTWGASGNPWMGPAMNLSQGFQCFVETWRRDLETGLPRPKGAPHPANAAFERFLESRDPARPFFAFINYMDAHMPFAPPEPYLSRFLKRGTDPGRALRLGEIKWTEYYRGRSYTEQDLETLSDLYDAGLAHLSAEVGRLLQITEQRGLSEQTLIVITSDHGEHFGENGLLGHVFGLYNTAVRVPLMIRPPGGVRTGEVDARKGQLVDLFATLLSAAGADTSKLAHRGVDLLAPGAGPGRESIFSEYYYPTQVLWQFKPEELEREADRIAPFRRRLRAIQRYGFRFIWSSNGRHELYDLNADPGEKRNLYDSERRSDLASAVLGMLTRELEGYLPDSTAEPRFEPDAIRGESSVDLDGETLEALRAVGYVDELE